MFKLHSFSEAEYSNEQQFGWPLHRAEHSEIVASIDDPPIWPGPQVSPGISTNPAGQITKKIVLN